MHTDLPRAPPSSAEAGEGAEGGKRERQQQVVRLGQDPAPHGVLGMEIDNRPTKIISCKR